MKLGNSILFPNRPPGYNPGWIAVLKLQVVKFCPRDCPMTSLMLHLARQFRFAMPSSRVKRLLSSWQKCTISHHLDLWGEDDYWHWCHLVFYYTCYYLPPSTTDSRHILSTIPWTIHSCISQTNWCATYPDDHRWPLPPPPLAHRQP